MWTHDNVIELMAFFSGAIVGLGFIETGPVLGRYMLIHLGVTCSGCNLLLDTLSKMREYIHKERWSSVLSCGFEIFQNQNKLFLLNPNVTQLPSPSPDFLLDAVALLTHPPFSSSSSLSEVLPFAALYFLFSDHAFWLTGKHLFPRLLISAMALLFPLP